ncbi:DNA glycosylase, partial [Dendrothele bispora CBS 962.96]
SEDQVEVDKEETAEEADDWLLAALQETKSIIQSENQVEVDKSDVVELDEQLDRTSTRGKRSSSKSLENNGIPAGSSSSSSSSNRKNAHYASPEKYAHLNPITDRMAEELDVVFCGINPGQTSGANGFHFSGPGNRFWPALSKSKLTEGQKVVYTDGSDLPSRFNLGLTDLVSRPTACLKELSVEEKKAAVPSFLQKVSQYRPRIVCFMGLETPSNIFRTVVCQTFSTSDNQVAGTSKTKSTKPKAQKMKVGNMNIKLVHRGVTDPNAVRETIFWALASTSGVCGQYQISSHVSFMNEVYEYLNRLKEGTVSTSEMFSIELPLDS